MTRQRDIGRVLDEWLAPGPIEAPDRILDVLADRIATTPQQRFPRANERFRPMIPFFKLLAAATLAIAAGVFVGPLAVNQQDRPSPSTSPSPVATPLAVLPDALRHSWVGDYRIVEGLDNADDWALAFDLLPRQFKLGMGSAGKLASIAEIDPDNHLRLESVLESQGCHVGDVGTYTWALSLRNVKLTLTPVSDDCAVRADVLTGDFYTSDLCQWPGHNYCLGPLDAGIYDSVQFDLRGIGEDQIKWRRGLVRYTVPQGWANADDGNYLFWLTPQASYDRVVSGESPWGDLVFLHARPAALTTKDLCTPWADTSIGRSADALTSWLTHHPALTATKPERIIIDGFQGWMLDIDIAPGWTQTCPEWGSEGAPTGPIVPLWYDANDLHNNPTDQLDSEDGWWGVGGTGEMSDPQRVILLDAGMGDTLLILVDSQKAADEPAFIEQAMPIVRKLEFPI